MRSRLTLDPSGRLVAVGTGVELRGLRWLVLDMCALGWFTPRGRPASPCERMGAKAPYLNPKLTSVWADHPPEPELDEREAIKAAYTEQRRELVDLLNVAA